MLRSQSKNIRKEALVTTSGLSTFAVAGNRKSRRSTFSTRVLASAALSVCAAIASTAQAVEIKPGDVILATNSNNSSGAGRVYVYDPVANTVQQIGGNYFNGVGGLAVDRNFNIFVGTAAQSSTGAGRIFSVNPTTGASTQVGSTQYFNGITSLAMTPAGDLYVGTGSSSTAGSGSIHSVAVNYNNFAASTSSALALTRNGNPYNIANAVGDMVLDTANNQLIVGTASMNTSGTGQLMTVDLSNNVTTRVGTTDFTNGLGSLMLTGDGSNRLLVGTATRQTQTNGRMYAYDTVTPASNPNGSWGNGVNYLNGVTAITGDYLTGVDGSVYMGTSSNNAVGTGKLYSVNAATGVTTQLNPTLPDSVVPFQFPNGITAMTVVAPQLDFVGGNNVTITSSATTSAFRTQVDPIEGTIGHYTLTTNQNLLVDDIYTSLAQDDASVRTGSGLPNNEQGDMTLGVNIDFDQAVTGTMDTRHLVFRSADDLTISNSITDGNLGSTDNLNLSLYARNDRRTVLDNASTGGVDERTGIDSANNDFTPGLLTLSEAISLGSGDFYAYGVRFDNTAANATITTLGAVGIDMLGELTVSNTIATDSGVVFTAGQFLIEGAGAVHAVGGSTMPVDAFSIVATAGDVIDRYGPGASEFTTLNYDGSVTINAPIYSNTFSSTGANFSNSVALSSDAGNFSILHSGTVTIGANIVSTAQLTINSGTFDNPGGTIQAAGAAFMTATSSTTFSQTFNSDALTLVSPTLAVNAAMTVTTDATISATDVSTTATVYVGGNSVFNTTGWTTFNNTLDVVGTLDMNGGTDFTSTSPITVGQSATIDQNGFIHLDNLTVSSSAAIVSTGSDFISNALTIGTTLDVSAPTGITFNGAVDTGGVVTLTSDSGLVTINNTFQTGGSSVWINSNSYLNTGAGVISDTGAMDFVVDTSIQVDGTITSGSITSTSDTFTTTAAVDITGLINVQTVNAIVLAPSMTVSTTGDFVSSSSSFTSEVLDFDSNVMINALTGITINGASTIGGTFTGTSLSGMTSLNNTLGMSGSTFTVTAQSFTSSAAGDVTGAGLSTWSIADASIIDGDFDATEVDFDTGSITTSGFFTVHGNYDLVAGTFADYNGNVTLDNGGNFTASTGSTFDSVGVVFSIDGLLDIESGGDISLGQTTTGSTIQLNDAANSISVLLDNATQSTVFTSAGWNFTTTLSTGTLTTTSGTITLNHTGMLDINADFTSTADFIVTGNGFDNTGGIGNVAGLSQLTISGPVTVGTNLSTGTFVSTGTTFNTSSGATLTSTGTANITHTDTATIDGPMITGPLTVDVPSIYTTATIDAAGTFTLSTNPSAGVTVFGANVTTTSSGDLIALTGYDFTSTGYTLSVAGATQIDRVNAIATSAVTSGASITTNSTSFVSDGLIQSLGGDITITTVGNSIDIGAGATSFGMFTATNMNSGPYDSTSAPILAGGAITIHNGVNDPWTAGNVSTSGMTGSSITVTGGNMIFQDSSLVTTAGSATFLSTVSGADMAASAGISVTGGDLAFTGTVGPDMDLSTVGGNVDVTGSTTFHQTGDIWTDNIVSGTFIEMTTDSAKFIETDELHSGTSTYLFGSGARVQSTWTAGTDATIEALDALVDLGGNATVGGNFRSTGPGSNSTFDNTGTTLTTTGSTHIEHGGAVTIGSINSGTSLYVETYGASNTFEAFNDVTSGTWMTIIAPGGITVNSPVQAGSDVTLTAVNGLIDINTPLTLTSGNLTTTSIDLENTDGPIMLPGNFTMNHGGSILLDNDVTVTGSTSTISFSNNPALTIRSADVTMHNAPGSGSLLNFSGGVVGWVIEESFITSRTGYVGSVTSGDITLDGGNPIDFPEMVHWHNSGNLYVGGSATNAAGSGILTVGPNACLDVDGTLKIWAGDTVNLFGGQIEFSTLNTDNNQGIFNWYGGQITDSDNLIVSVFEPIRVVLGVGTGTSMTLRVMNDRHLVVVGRTTLNSTLYLDGGTFSTGTLQNGQRLTFLSGVFNLNNDDFYITPTTGTPGRGTLGNRTITLGEESYIFVNGAGKKTFIDPNGLLQLTGGEFRVGDELRNSGTVAMSSPASRLLGGAITNNLGGLIFGTGSVEPTIINNGEIRSSFTEVLKFNGVNNVINPTGVARLVNGGTMEFPLGLSMQGGQILGDGTLITGETTITSGPGINPPTFSGDGIFIESGVMNFAAKTDVYGDVVIRGSFATSKIISSGGATTSFYGDVFQVDGEIRAGELSKIVYFGLLKGNLNLTGVGTHIIEGTLDGGFSPGRGDFANVVFTGGEDRFLIELGGTTAAMVGDHGVGFYDTYNFETLGFDASAENPVEINVELWGGFVPAIGQSFDVISFSELGISDFTQINDLVTLNLPSGFDWDATWSSTGLNLAVVPEPTTLALLGATSMLMLRRKQK